MAHKHMGTHQYTYIGTHINMDAGLGMHFAIIEAESVTFSWRMQVK